jgi:hypothetical protein
MTLQKNILDRLRAGALVALVEEADEILAIAACEMAAKALPPGTCEVLSILADDFIDKFKMHKDTGRGVIIVADLLRAMGNNPQIVRMIREFALQSKAPPYPRLILVEAPGIEVPPSLKGDIEYVIPPLPTVDELKQELEIFIKDQNVKLEGNGETKHAIAQSLAGLARHEASRLLARCWVDQKKLDCAWLRRSKAERVTERLGGALSFVDVDSPDVGGQANLLGWVDTRSKTFASEKAKIYGLPEIKGLLIAGIPGTGKSLDVKHIARKIGLPLLRLDVGKLFGSLVGQSESQVRQAIEAAEACAPCIMWIDEIEKGLSGMKGGGGDGGTTQRVFGTILTWLQEKKKPVFVVATANRVFDLPPELLRKGRFDEIFFVDLPTAKEREEIARIHVLRRKRDVAVLVPKTIADACDGFSGAEIEQAIIDGMFTAYADGEREVTIDDIQKAAGATMPLSKTMAEDITKQRQWAKGRARMAGTPAETPKPTGGSGYGGVTRTQINLNDKEDK